jgi:hypothetical protein
LVDRAGKAPGPQHGGKPNAGPAGRRVDPISDKNGRERACVDPAYDSPKRVDPSYDR